jgi:acetyl esterase/lipase
MGKTFPHLRTLRKLELIVAGIQCAANASKLGANPDQGFIVGGTSAGGNISAVISHLARDEKLSPPLTGIWLHIPMVVHPDAVPEKYKADYGSYEQNKDALIIGVKAVEWLLSATPFPFYFLFIYLIPHSALSTRS